MSIYDANYQQNNVDEARYQTIGRGHGFSELDGVTFKISDKYSSLMPSPEFVNQLNALRIVSDRCPEEAYLYSFEAENKVLSNMTVNGY